MPEAEELGYRIINGFVAFMVALAFIFIGVCILIFCLSHSRTGKFLNRPSRDGYSKANSLYAASIVFLVLISLFTLSGVSGFFICLAEVFEETDPVQRTWDIVEIVEFLTAVTALVLGIRALSVFGKAKVLYKRMFPPQTAYYYNQQQPYIYPQQFNPRQFTPQQNYPQQYYQQPVNPQQSVTPQQPVTPQQNIYNTAPTEKMCPHCGVINDGKNQVCMFCGKNI